MYTLNGHCLEQVASQKDLGVVVSNNLKATEHVNGPVTKANQRIGLIRRCFTGLTNLKVRTLYGTIIRPILEYASPAWNPHLKKDINNLEKVQKRCLRLSSTEITGFDSLEFRRKFADLCEVYKFTHNMYKTDVNKMFSFSKIQLRGHSLKLEKSYSRTSLRQHFFSNRVVDAWNGLPEAVVSAPSLPCFKKRLRSLLSS